jgi:hypothetical protein
VLIKQLCELGITLDDDAAHRIIRGCMNANSRATVDEIVHFSKLKVRQLARRRNIENIVGMLIMSVPAYFVSPATELERYRTMIAANERAAIELEHHRTMMAANQCVAIERYQTTNTANRRAEIERAESEQERQAVEQASEENQEEMSSSCIGYLLAQRVRALGVTLDNGAASKIVRDCQEADGSATIEEITYFAELKICDVPPKQRRDIKDWADVLLRSVLETFKDPTRGLSYYRAAIERVRSREISEQASGGARESRASSVLVERMRALGIPLDDAAAGKLIRKCQDEDGSATIEEIAYFAERDGSMGPLDGTQKPPYMYLSLVPIYFRKGNTAELEHFRAAMERERVRIRELGEPVLATSPQPEHEPSAPGPDVAVVATAASLAPAPDTADLAS